MDSPGEARRLREPIAGPEAQGSSVPELRSILDSVQDLRQLLADSSCVPLADGREIVARSGAMRELLEQAGRVAASDASVLIEGESGTGKELVARWIHSSSRRVRQPFVRVNCAALSESLVESELFGHDKGAFTGAIESRVGRFELAHGGTLLLDEIAEVSVKLQAKLLRVLEEQEFERVGGTRSLHVDVRVLATTNRDLQQELAQGRFRLDLYYRLNVVRIRLAPLRERKEDIPAFVAHFLQQYGQEGAVVVRGVSPRAMEMLTAYDWPGNVRQLRNVLYRACILSLHESIQPQDLPPFDSPSTNADARSGGTLEELERCAILSALRAVGGNKTAAARRLGVTSRTLLNKLKKYRAQGTASQAIMEERPDRRPQGLEGDSRT